MNDNSEFREGQKQDKQKIYDAMILALQTDPLAFSSEWFELASTPKKALDSFILNYVDSTNNRMFLCTSKQKIVGFVGIIFNNRLRSKHIGEVYWLYVLEEYRNKKIAKKLMNMLLDHVAKYPDMKKLKLSVNAKQDIAIQFYKKLGFVEVGRLKDELVINSEFIDVILMEMYL